MSKKRLDKDQDIGYNVPTSLPVCGVEVPVEVNSDLEHDGEFRADDMEKATLATIQIHDKVHSECRERVLIHEAIHAILWSTGLSEVLGDRAEEAVCTTLDKHLGPVLERLAEGRQRGEKPRPRREPKTGHPKGTTRKK